MTPTHKKLQVIEPYQAWFDLRLGEVWSYRTLVAMLTWREITIRYKQTLLGIGWVVLQPLLMLLIFTAIFSLMIPQQATDYPFAIFVFPGLIVWRFMSDGVMRSTQSLMNNARLIEKVYFPRLVVVLAAVLAATVDMLVALVLLLIGLALTGVTLTAQFLLAPLYLLLAGVVVLTAALWLAPLSVRYRDVNQALPFLLQISLYLAPIFYPITLIPEPYRALYSLNPMVTVVEGFRWAVLGINVAPLLLPSVASTVALLVLFVLGVAFFKRSEADFADYI